MDIAEQVRRLVKAVDSLMEKEAKREHDAAMEKLAKFHTAVFTEATRYTEKILVGGYAAVFALIASLKDMIPEAARMWALLFVIISIVIFIAFEIYKMAIIAIFKSRYGMAIGQKDPLALISKVEQIEVRAHRHIMVIWVCVLVPTVVTGLMAMGTLMWNVVAGIAQRL